MTTIDRVVDTVVLFYRRGVRGKRAYVSLRSSNGQKIFTSEAYTNHQWARFLAQQTANELGVRFEEEKV